MARMNEAQLEAIEHLEGPLLILAGAGSGKTRVITERIIRLVRDRRVPPWSVLAVTFTNKAAREMRDRVEQVVGPQVQDMFIRTFHSIGLFILRNDGYLLDIPRHFSIYDTQDSESLIKRILKERQIDTKELSASLVLNTISRQKDQMILPAAMHNRAQEENDPFLLTVADIYDEYDKSLRRFQALDFNDLLLKALDLLVNHREVLQKYRDMWRYIMVDEYQDTNRVQYYLTRLLALEHNNLCVVGDDDQSIYSWRGADIRNILDFQKDFSKARVVKLEQNYRSTSVILQAASSVVANNQNRMGKTLWTGIDGGLPVVQYYFLDEREEADWVVSRIEKTVYEKGVPFNNVAVFYRMNYQSRSFEERLRKRGLPYIVYGGLKFYDRKEIKDIISYLRFVINPEDDVSLRRIINTPARGVGNTTVEKLQNTGRDNGVSLWQAVSFELARGKKNKKLAAMRDLMSELLQKGSEIGENYPLHQFVAFVVERSGYWAMLEEEGSVESDSRKENLEELINSIAEREAEVNKSRGEPLTLEEYLQEIGLYTDAEDPDARDLEGKALNLMTVHNAKGLEFHSVFMSGMEEGIFPHNSAIKEEEESGEIADMEEERRLCYVGITRAQKELFMTSCRIRRHFGNPMPRDPSRFLTEIGPEIVDKRYSPRTGYADDGPVAESQVAPEGAGHAAGRRTYKRGFATDEAIDSPMGYRQGQKVRHPRYGVGWIQEIVPSGNFMRLYISFGGGKAKPFLDQYTPLEVLEE